MSDFVSPLSHQSQNQAHPKHLETIDYTRLDSLVSAQGVRSP